MPLPPPPAPADPATDEAALPPPPAAPADPATDEAALPPPPAPADPATDEAALPPPPAPADPATDEAALPPPPAPPLSSVGPANVRRKNNATISGTTKARAQAAAIKVDSRKNVRNNRVRKAGVRSDRNRTRRARFALGFILLVSILGVGFLVADGHLAGAKQRRVDGFGENATQKALDATNKESISRNSGESNDEKDPASLKSNDEKDPAKVFKIMEPTEPDPDDLEAMARASGIPPESRVFLFHGGKVEVVSTDKAEKRGFSTINLSDDFAPYIFSERTPESMNFKPNNYRRIYMGVSNDRIDEDGRRLEKNQHNHVELFGIPPTLSVLQRRFITDASKECYKKLNSDLLKKYRGVIRFNGSNRSGEYLDRYEELRKQVLAARKRHGNISVDELARRKKHAYLVQQYRIAQVRVAVIHQAQLRLRCEGLLDKDERYRRRHMDYITHRAIARFERKHMIFGWGQLHGNTVKYLGSDPSTNNHRALIRVLRERVVHSLGILEDGTADKHENAVYEHDGKKHKVPNLVKTYTDILTEELGWGTPEKASEFFHNYPPEFFANFHVGVKLPERPPYYEGSMTFSVELDRGDVWYDYPYDAAGNRRSQPRSRLPHITLFANWRNQRIALVRWPTTIGGWRREYKNGRLYLAYKESPPGLKSWRNIVAAPVWVPPATTPPSALLDKEAGLQNGRYNIKRKEMGPSYRSAYGLVVAYHLEHIPDRPGAWMDGGIRTHGSVNYMSIFGGFSNGCHRLHNHLAVRLFSYILRHNGYVRDGQIPLAYARNFNYRKKQYRIEMDTRGYRYSLQTPIQVTVTEGRIRGRLKEPISHYMPHPRVKYAADDPNLKPEADMKEGWAPEETLPSDVPPEDDKPIQPGSSDISSEEQAEEHDNQDGDEPDQAPKKEEKPAEKPAPVKQETETSNRKEPDSKDESPPERKDAAATKPGEAG